MTGHKELFFMTIENLMAGFIEGVHRRGSSKGFIEGVHPRGSSKGVIEGGH